MTICQRCGSSLQERYDWKSPDIDYVGDYGCVTCGHEWPAVPAPTLAERIAAHKAAGIYGPRPSNRGRPPKEVVR